MCMKAGNSPEQMHFTPLLNICRKLLRQCFSGNHFFVLFFKVKLHIYDPFIVDLCHQRWVERDLLAVSLQH